MTKFSGQDLNNFVTALAISAPVIVFCNLQLRVIQALDAKETYSFGAFMVMRLIAQIISILTIAVWSFATYSDFDLIFTVLAVSVGRSLYSIGETFFGEQQRVERMEGIASSMAIKGLVSLISFSYFLIYLNSFSMALGSWVLVHGISLIYDFKKTQAVSLSRGKAEIILDKKPLLSLLKKGLPLGLSGLLISLQINIPNYALLGSIHHEEIGVFGAILYIATIGRKIIESAVRAAGPRLSKILSEGRIPRFKRLRFKLTFFSAGLGVIGLLIMALFGDPLLGIIYTEKFLGYLLIPIWLLIGESLNFAALALEHALSAGSHFSAQLTTTTWSVICLAIFAFTLVPVYGVDAAAWAVALGGLVRLLSALILTKKYGPK